AEDLSQEIFLNIYRNLKKFRHESKFSTWVYRIVMNHCINRSGYLKRRHASKHDSLTTAPRDGEPTTSSERELVAPQPTPERELQRKETQRLIQEGISRLQEDFRQILILRDIEGRSYEEIAEILQISIGTVKSRIHRARMNLKAQLDGRLA
ncbi:MAG: sigma-70 family RNA polymerase sigma factor, partial [Deltaproteobacteria bacterium]